ncbi:YkgJ family cysteine cluster protein [Desulforamulus hydrothermalis]|uniref:Uncharacterized protein n=1 Tax=Desulforamulus hydrothermalis Lam5 = DSM 18033 TaxID=1121428 RepID=K8DZH7_9FIRM|nr:YkgJ family cysteine cluster protein [Desulforamulus hydrothermalis]CCO08370.1 conserved hypothetical protein [Desulforamulus hydrothermalis Lam5 = DSM 18033]SHH14058.1 Putative zinc-or iron-chelating domain-containing protein [Desulforamulus hydrothermalis Lam5 = DSM 18033]
MTRLPLDYQKLYAGWRALVPAVKAAARLFPPLPAAEVWQNKLQLMHNIIRSHPDTGDCDRCGRCCREFPFACRPIEFFYLLPHLAGWPEQQQEQFFLWRLGQLEQEGRSRCPFLESAGCAIYAGRPLVCRRSIFGRHICNKQARQFDSFGEWCNMEEVLKQLTLTNLVYYYEDADGRHSELYWPLNRLKPPAAGLTVAPLEIWLLLLLDDPAACRRLIDLAYYRPLLAFYPA